MTISVMACSTWRRVFISRKKNSPVLVDEELDGPRVDIAAVARHGQGSLTDCLAGALLDGARRGLLDELLVTPLDGAVTLAEEDPVAVVVETICASMCRGRSR